MSAEKDYLSLPLQTFLTDLAAKAPTPGGGSVAAMVGALAASQARMVIAYTAGKKRFAEHETLLQESAAEFERAEAVFTQLMSEDMAAYERFSAASKSDNDEERQLAVATAAAVPMEIVALAAVLAKQFDTLKDKVNPYLLSDLQVSAILAFASARAAALNVRINIKEMADQDVAKRLEAQFAELIDHVHQHRSAVVHYVAG